MAYNPAVMAKPPLRIAVIGAGPIGLEAALYAQSLGLDVRVYEKGPVADHLLRWGHVRLFTPFGMNVTPLGRQALLRENPKRELPHDGDFITGREFREAYLVPLAESSALLESLHPQHAVLYVGRGRPTASEPMPGFRLLVRSDSGQERLESADVVLDCSGTYSRPNWLGEGNIPAVGELSARPHLATGLEDVLGARRDHYSGKSIVLVGDGYSAATTIRDLATLAESQPATWVFWLTRGPRGQQPLPRIPNDPLKDRDRLAARANSLATRCDANLEFHPQTVIEEVLCHGPDKGFRVAARSGGKLMTWEVERVIANVGYRPDLRLCETLRVREPSGDFLTDEPGYYVLGAKSRGRRSDFLLTDGFDQIRRVFERISGQPRLNLYATKAA